MAAPKNLNEYFLQQGKPLPSVSERKTLYGLGNDYVGTAAQNAALLQKLVSGGGSAAPAAGAAAAPAAAPARTPVNVGAFTPKETELDRALQSLINQNKSDRDKKIDEEKIRQNTLRQFDAEFASIDRIYTDLLNTQLRAEEAPAADRMGMVRATQAAGGLLGSGRGASQAAEVEAYNVGIKNDIRAKINAEKSQRISALLGKARSISTAEIDRAREAKKKGAEEYIANLTTQQSRRKGNVSSVIKQMISQGVDINELTPDELKELAGNLKVDVNDLTQTYLDETKDSRAQMQAVSRENAIAGVIRQGITDPAEILDIVNFDDSGKQIGDISLEEINKILKGTSPEYKTLSEGQVLIDPKTGKVVYKNPKTYKPTGTSSGDGDYGAVTAPVQTYDQFKNSAAAKEIIAAAEQERQMSLAPSAREEVLKAAYAEATANTQSATGGKLGNLTPEDKRTLQQGGLSGAPAQAQSYFLNAPSEFRQYYSRGVATGDFSPNASLDEIDEVYTAWYNAKEEGGDDLDLDDL